ncbi:MAG: molecular chaperone TorD family protein [Gammaproteobacteria bacterium]|nr:molecular chaperone TorD family protein [Gammaproteobacteria bacterium]
MNTHQPQIQQTVDAPTAAPADSDEQAHRAAVYSLLAALLRDYPEQVALDYAAQLPTANDESRSGLGLAFSMLALAARHTPAAGLRDEYHALFIGLGRGELVPYGSWYQTGFLMEKPLGQLRADLATLGFERNDDVREPEDHIAALCEVMAYLITENATAATQRRFFESHVAGWAGTFFEDLENAENAVFYRSVARLGSSFVDIEHRYLTLFD